jgi:hypothetical protein
LLIFMIHCHGMCIGFFNKVFCFWSPDPSLRHSLPLQSYILRTFQDTLASNASRFQSKKYTPDSRMLTYLKVRRAHHDFIVPVPSFMKKRTNDKGKGAQHPKRGRSQIQQSRSLTYL